MNLYPATRRITLGVLPSGPEGIRRTLRVMSSMVRVAKKDPGIRELACQLVRGFPQYDRNGEVRALHAFVRDHIRYTGDIRGVETIQTPRVTLQTGVGDCDDKSTLLASLLESINRATRLVAVGFSEAGGYSHVLVEVRAGKSGKWVPLETIKPVEVGWQPAGIKRRMVAHN
jgi:transglutaminase-like putative cysteine protease